MPNNQENDDTFQLLSDWLTKDFGINSNRIKPSSRLREDLGIDGDDGYDLFVALNKKFGINISEFVHDRHFAHEGFSPLELFTRSWWKDQKKTITVSDLVDAFKSGKWKERSTQQ